MNPTDLRLIAFYLPQFHPCPENDRWWGRGFTEWTNVTRAAPLFPGHVQPQLPGDLGFCDLRLPEVREAQADLARQAGIHGFCYYHYWFNGQRLLHRPLDEVIASGKPDFPFCVCWANENWTRRWDGLDSEILIAQRYAETDPASFLRDLLPALRDPRYIRINGRPLLLVYRPEKIPDPIRWAECWRKVARDEGLGELYLVNVQGFSAIDPTTIGFDAAVEFPPLGGLCDRARLSPPEIQEVCGHGSNFQGSLVDYRAVVRAALEVQPPAYRRFRGVMPAWDNTARRQQRAMVLTGANPGAYEAWLSAVLRDCLRRERGDERLVFINAWNEWAEGCHLEPDQQWGHGYLAATRAALLAATAAIAAGATGDLANLLESRECTIRALTDELSRRDDVFRQLRRELAAAQRAALAAPVAASPGLRPGGAARAGVAELGTAGRRGQAVIFGASAGGARALQFLRSAWEVEAFVDNNAAKHGTKWEGLPVIGPAELERFPDAAVFLATMYAAEVQEQLLGLGLARERLRHVDPRILDGTQVPGTARAERLEVIIFGAGAGGQRALAQLPAECRMVAFVDNDPAKIGTTVAGHPVIHAGELLSRNYDHVIVASMYTAEILEQLDHLGVPAHKIEVVHPDILLGTTTKSARDVRPKNPATPSA